MKIKKLLYKAVLSASLIGIAGNVYAQGIPVYDNTANLHLIEQLLKAKEEFDLLTKQYNSMTGGRNMGSYANTSQDALLRRYVPNNMDDLLSITGGAALPPDISSSYSEQQRLYKPLTAAELNPANPERPEIMAYEQHVKTTYAATAASEAAYNNAANNLETYEGLLSELNNTPDLKASVDLQTRTAIQNGLLMNEILKQNALILQLQAAENNQELAARRQIYDATKEGE